MIKYISFQKKTATFTDTEIKLTERMILLPLTIVMNCQQLNKKMQTLRNVCREFKFRSQEAVLVPFCQRQNPVSITYWQRATK